MGGAGWICLITTKEKLSELLEVRVYNCSDLIEMVKATAPEVGVDLAAEKPPPAAGGATMPGAARIAGSHAPERRPWRIFCSSSWRERYLGCPGSRCQFAIDG